MGDVLASIRRLIAQHEAEPRRAEPAALRRGTVALTGPAPLRVAAADGLCADVPIDAGAVSTSAFTPPATPLRLRPDSLIALAGPAEDEPAIAPTDPLAAVPPAAPVPGSARLRLGSLTDVTPDESRAAPASPMQAQ